MNTVMTGIVEAINARSTRIGDMYDVVVNGQKFGNGKYAPRGVKVGDTVTFEFTTKVNGQYTNRDIVAKTLRVESGGAGSPSPSQQSQPAPVQTSAARAYVAPDKRQEVISKQSAMNTALTLIGLQLAHGAVKLPAKVPDAYTTLNTLLATTAARVYEINTGEVWNITAKDFVEGKATAEQADPDFVDDDLPF